MIHCEAKVKQIDAKWGTVFVAAGNCIIAYADSKDSEILARFNPNIDDIEINTIKYAREQDRVYAGYTVIL